MTKSQNDEDNVECCKQYRSVYRDDMLKNKVAFVSGGGTGICFRIVEALMRHGCKVAIGSRREHVVQSAKVKLERDTNGICFALCLDVRQKSSIEKAVDCTMNELGPIDILINGAAGNFLAPAHKLSANAFRTVLDIDTTGSFLLSQCVFNRCMKERGGTIVNIGATLHFNGELMQVHAGSAKAAIEAMTRHLANEWGSFGVRVNTISPGPISDTVGFRKLGGFLPPAFTQQHLSRIALRRFGSTEDIAQSVLYLVSDAAAYTTGANLVVDGGAWFFSGGIVGEAMAKMSKL